MLKILLKYNLLLTILLFNLTSFSSQEIGKLDSLKTILSQNKNISSNTFNKISDEYFYISYDSSLKYSNLAYKSALDEKNEKEQAVALNLIGLLELNRAFYYSALSYFLRSLELAKSVRDTALIFKLYNNIGVAYIDLRNYKRAEKYLKLALRNNDTNKQGNIFNNLGLIYHVLEKFDSALESYNKALVSYKATNDSIGIATAVGNIGRIYRELGNYDKAIEFLHKSRNLYIKKADKLNEVAVILNLGITFFRNNKIDSAHYYLTKSLKMSQANDYNKIITRTFFYLSLMYEEMQDYNKSISYYKDYHNTSDSLITIKKQKQINDLNIKYETAKRNKTIELLNKDNEINEERIAMQNKWLNVLILIVVVVLLFTLLIYFMKRKLYQSDINLVNKNLELAKKEKSIKSKQIKKTEIVKELKYVLSGLSEEQKIKLYNLVVNAMENEKLFLQIDLTINKLSEHLNISRTYLSQVINELFNKNFNTLINEYRIKEARDMLIENKDYTIEGIAREVGFKSKSSFNTAFKKYTGLTPSFFMKNTLLSK